MQTLTDKEYREAIELAYAQWKTDPEKSKPMINFIVGAMILHAIEKSGITDEDRSKNG
jgi:hypothetical protein